MTRRKIIGLSVGGFAALSIIGNAVSPSTPPHKAKAATPTAHVVKATPKHSKVKLICGSDAYTSNDSWNPPCKMPPKPLCGKDTDSDPTISTRDPIYRTGAQRYEYSNCVRTPAQKRHDAAEDKRWVAQTKQKESQPDSCAGKASSLALVEALSGNVGGAVGAGKLALATAGTGAKC